MAEELFIALVKECREKGVISSEVIAIDSTAINAYEQKQARHKSKNTGNGDWGAQKDSFGNTVAWFGYKLHLVVDTKSELPIAFEVTPANVNDGDLGPVLIEKVISSVSIQITGWSKKSILKKICVVTPVLIETPENGKSYMTREQPSRQ